MSDLEALPARQGAAAPASTRAIGKLRTIGRSGSPLAQSDGLFDAFAEVFAQMAAAQTGHKTLASSKPPFQRNDATAVSRSDADSIEEPIAIGAQPPSLPLESDTQRPLEHQPLQPPSEAASQEAGATASNAELVDRVAVEVRTEDIDDDVEPMNLATEEPVEPGDFTNRHRRRDRAPQRPIDRSGGENSQAKHLRGDAHQIPNGTGTVGLETEQRSQQTIDHAENDPPHRVRGRRLAGDPTPQRNRQPVSHSGHRRSDSSSVTAKSATVSDVDATSPMTAVKAVAPNTTSTVSSVQNVISNVSNVARSNTPTPSLRLGPTTTSGSNPAIDPMTSGREHVSAKAGDRATKSNTAETLSRVKLIQRVSRAFQHLGPEGGVVRLRLAPAEMGSVRIEMRIHQRKVQARVIAETEAASAVLREHLPELRMRLEVQRMEIERLDVETEQGETEFGRHTGGQGSRDSSDSQGRSPFPRAPAIETARPTTPAGASPPVSRSAAQPSTRNGVDIRL